MYNWSPVHLGCNIVLFQIPCLNDQRPNRASIMKSNWTVLLCVLLLSVTCGASEITSDNNKDSGESLEAKTRQSQQKIHETDLETGESSLHESESREGVKQLNLTTRA